MLRRSSSIALLVLAGVVADGAPNEAAVRITAQAAASGINQRHECAYVNVGGRFYLLGGRGIKPVDIFDPATGTWSHGAPPPVEIHHFQGVAFDGKIYAIGAMTGRYPTEPPLSNVYIYDPAADTWTTGPEVPADRRRGGAGAVIHDGEILLIAGITNGHSDGHVRWVDAFNPRTGSWRRLPDAPRARDHFQAAILDGKVYVAGGRRSSFATGQTFQLTVPEVDVFDLATSTWSTLPASANLPTPRAGCTAVVVNGRVLIIGGESAQPLAHDTVEAYDPATGRWSLLAPLGMGGRHATQGILHDGRIYLASGSRTQGATEVTTQDVYIPRW